MKTIIPWLLMVIAAAGAVFFYTGNQSKTAELAKLQAQVQELEALRTEVEELKKNQISPEELARLKDGRDELLRLRNQVRQLTTEKSQLSQQAQAAKSAAEQAQAQNQALTQAQNQAIAKVQEQANAVALNTCLNHLRQIDGAKHQWALEQNKPANATPAESEVAAYLPGQALPACPNGGKYTVGSVSGIPACSTPGHVLPPPTQ